MKVRKKPIIVEAFQVTDIFSEKTTNIPKWLFDGIVKGTVILINPENKQTFIVKSPEGNHIGNDGDYIIKGIKDELYICKKDIFESSYEVVEV